MLVPHREQCALTISKTNSDFTVRSVRNTYELNVKMDKMNKMQNFSLNMNVNKVITRLERTNELVVFYPFNT
jgi:arginyl-tRNA synthetase